MRCSVHTPNRNLLPCSNAAELHLEPCKLSGVATCKGLADKAYSYLALRLFAPVADKLFAVQASASQLPSRKPLLLAFGNDEEEDQPRRRLVPLQYSEEELRGVQQAEQASAAGLASPAPEDFEARKRSIIDSLPSSQKDVFNFAINWDAFTSAKSAVASRIRTYVSKKIAELLGEEEQTLVDFVMEKLQEHAQAQQMLNELVEVLDEDAQGFVLKLYRTVIYETQKFAILGV